MKKSRKHSRVKKTKSTASKTPRNKNTKEKKDRVGEFLRNYFSGAFSWGFLFEWILRGLSPLDQKQVDKSHPNLHSKIQIRIWEFCGQIYTARNSRGEFQENP